MLYMDYNATTPLDPQVLNSIQDALKEYWANPSSSYAIGVKCKKAIVEARENVAEMIGSKPSEIIFTSGGTESNHLVFHSIIEHYKTAFKKVSDEQVNGYILPTIPHIISTNIEHDSVSLPLKHWAGKGQIDVTFVPVNKETGQLEIEDVMKEVKPNTCLISVMLANNETGILQPVAKLSQAIKLVNRERLFDILIHTDAAQALGKIPVDVQELAVDYLTIVGHKFYGPRIGALFVRDLEQKSCPFYPLFHGGGQERHFRPGTENTAMIIGLGKASKLVNEHLDEYEQHMKANCDYLESSLLKHFGNGVKINNKKNSAVDRLPNTCSAAFVGSTLKVMDLKY